MKVIVNKDDFKIIVYKNEIDCDLTQKEVLEKYIKKIVVNIKRNSFISINGFYKVNVYHNEKFGMILDIIKEEDLDFFNDFLDFKVIVNYNSDVYLAFDDYFIINNRNIYYYEDKYYINIDYLSDGEILRLSEFSKIIFGSELDNIKSKFKLVMV